MNTNALCCCFFISILFRPPCLEIIYPVTNIPGIGHFPKVPPLPNHLSGGGGKLPNSLMPMMPNGPNDFPLNMEEIDDGTVLSGGGGPHADDQRDKEGSSSFTSGLLLNTIFIAVVLVIGVVILAVFYRGSGVKKTNNNSTSSPSGSPAKSSSNGGSSGNHRQNGRTRVHGSWESGIDSNHNNRAREQAMLPVRLFTGMTNWFNRKKRLFHARRGRRSAQNSRLPNQPKTRAMFYYKNGRAAAALASGGNGSTGDENNSSTGTHWSFGSNGSRQHSTGSPTDQEATAALISAHHITGNQRLPPISLVSNPNYFSEAEQHLLENSCKYNSLSCTPVLNSNLPHLQPFAISATKKLASLRSWAREHLVGSSSASSTT